LEFLFLCFYSIYSTISSVLLRKSLRLFHKVVFGVFHNLSLTMKEVNNFTKFCQTKQLLTTQNPW
jgi:hypothetical protein